MTVRLMLTCLCDAFYGEVGIATVRILEHFGCVVQFPEAQTCCGQPPFNAGDWDSARQVAGQWQLVFSGGDSPIVTPSASCAAMVRDGYAQLFAGAEASPVYELSEFLTSELRIDRWPSNAVDLPRRRIAFHRSCHGRAIGLADAAERLLGSVAHVEMASFPEPEQCCGFGGAFSVSHPFVSAGIGLQKLRRILESGVEEVVSGDMGCLMHLRGLIERNQLRLKATHFAEILAEALPA